MQVRTRLENCQPEAVAICQSTVMEILEAADIAEKSADVTVCELSGCCPQHITCLAIIGTISAVSAAIDSVQTKWKR